MATPPPLSLWPLFARFGALRGWRLPEAALRCGLTNISFTVAEGFARDFDVFAQQARDGESNWTLLRPRSTAL